jgi:hypothetical protein
MINCINWKNIRKNYTICRTFWNYCIFLIVLYLNFRLKLSVIMFKNDELLKNQPIKRFPLSNSSTWKRLLIYLSYEYVDYLDEQGNTNIYKHHDAYKQDFHLIDLQFIMNLCVQVDNKLHRLIQYQYMSGISTQDKNVTFYWWLVVSITYNQFF